MSHGDDSPAAGSSSGESTPSSSISVSVGRMGVKEPQTVELPIGASVDDAIKAADFRVGPNEKVHLNGARQEVSLDTVSVQNGDYIAIAGAKEGGLV